MKKVSSGLLSLVIALLLFEGLSRIVGSFVHDAAENNIEDWYVYSPELGWERKPGFEGIVTTTERTFDAEGFLEGDAPKLADSTKKKILFVGDSNVFGNDQPASKTFVALVDSLLPDAVTINLSAPGYSSYQGMILFRRALKRFHPDVVVVSFNYNDRRYVLAEEDADGAECFQRTYELAKNEERKRFMENFYVFRSVRFILLQLRILHEEKPITSVRIDTLAARVSPERYRENLSTIVHDARMNRIPVVFLLLKDNPVHTEYLTKGIRSLERHDDTAAIEQMKIASLQSTVFRTMAILYLSTAYSASGDSVKARDALLLRNPVNSQHGAFPIHLDGEYNNIMREVGEKHEAAVIDGASVLEKMPSVYYDFCHFDTTGHRMIAELLVPHLRRILHERK